MTCGPILCVIPARGGSKGLPGKNIRPLAGLPLLAHSIRCARMCPEVERLIVSTDSETVAAVAREHGAEVPFIRPAELATDTAPMQGVLQHALREMERLDRRRYGALLLLDPTSPGRLPGDIAKAVQLLDADPAADGVVGVSRPGFNPYWHCMVEKNGYMSPLIPGADRFVRRQDLPAVFRINASLYLWRRDFLLRLEGSWMNGRNVMLEIPEVRAIHIDDREEFERADLMIREGLVRLPWLERA
ncbi:MAG: acylneuraminate cytidylyltransferase family protein [Deltaproteobacteria bacterium]|nr:MAG: acylneuraminate cytidylyltransferase family protein [Deltaproteobacteria bacterium]